MGFRPDGNKSNGMAARTPWQAAATAAAGEVTERSGLGVSSAGSFLVRQHIAGVGYRSGRRRWGFRRNGWWICFYDGYTRRSKLISLIELFEVYYLRPGRRNREWWTIFAARVEKPWTVEIYRLRFVPDGMRNLLHLAVLKYIFMFKSNSLVNPKDL